MSHNDWVWTSEAPLTVELWQRAQHTLLELTSQGDDHPQDAKKLVNSELGPIARWLAAICTNLGTTIQARELVTRPNQFPSALGCILCKLLHDRLVGSTPSYCEVLVHLLTRDVCKALDCIVELHTHSVTPISARLVLASHLQQTGVLWHLAHAVGIQTKRFSSEIAQRASTISCAERTCQGSDTGHSRDEGAGNIAPCSRSFQKMIMHMLQLTVTVGGFWPGGAHKSAAARPLLPAAAKLAAALAHVASMLSRVDHANKFADKFMTTAVAAAHRLITIHHEAMKELSEADASHDCWWTLSRTPEFRQLLLMSLAAHAQLWLSGGQAQQQDAEVVQQLWSVMGYTPVQLSEAVRLQHSLLATDLILDSTGTVVLHDIHKIEAQLHELNWCWRLLEHSEAFPTAADQSPWQQLSTESQKQLLVMRVAKAVFLHGPDGMQGDIMLLLKAATCLEAFMSVVVKHIKASAQQNPSSAALPVRDIVQLLLQFLHYGRAVAQKEQRQDESPAGTSSINDSNTTHQLARLQHAVLKVIQNFAWLSDANRTMSCFLDAWLVWGQHVTQMYETALRSAVSTADDDRQIWLSLQEILEVSVYTWIKLLTGFNEPHSLLQRLRNAQFSTRGQQTAEAAAAASASSLASGYAAIELRLLSLMSSFCKALMQSMEIVPEVHVPKFRTEPIAGSFAVAVALVLEQLLSVSDMPHPTEQRLLQPAVLPWLSLLGRCLVMMGQRLKMMQADIHNAVKVQQRKHVLEMMLTRLQAEPQANQAQLPQQVSGIKTELQLCEQVASRQPQGAANLTQIVHALVRVFTILIKAVFVEPQQSQQQRHRADRTDTTAADVSSGDKAQLQQLLTGLLPTIVVMDGLCGIVSGDESSAWMDHALQQGRSGAAAAGVLAWCFKHVVSQCGSADLLQEVGGSAELDLILDDSIRADMMLSILGEASYRPLTLDTFGLMRLVLLYSKPYQQLQEQLIAIGSELVTALPHCWCCNNPGCDNLSADSELQLISGKQRICAGCTGGSTDKDINSTAARYCSVECQKQHWKQHKRVCRRLHKR